MTMPVTSCLKSEGRRFDPPLATPCQQQTCRSSARTSSSRSHGGLRTLPSGRPRVALEPVQHGAVAGAGSAGLGQAAGPLLRSSFRRAEVSPDRGDAGARACW